MEEIFGGEGVSIKNPYPVTYKSSMSIENNPKRDIFNEGVKAAVQWMNGDCPGHTMDNVLLPVTKRKDCFVCISEIEREFGI